MSRGDAERIEDIREACRKLAESPASSPVAVSCRRNSQISSTTAASVRLGEVRGRLGRGSNTASPSRGQRTTRRVTHDRDTP